MLWQPHCGNRKAQWAIRLLQATHTGMRQDSTTMWINHVHGYHPKVSPVHPTVYDSKMHHHLKPFWAKKKYHTKCTQQVDSSHSVSCKTMFFRITLVSHISSSSPSFKAPKLLFICLKCFNVHHLHTSSHRPLVFQALLGVRHLLNIWLL